MSTNQMATLKKNLADLQQKAKERTVKTQNIEYDLETLVKKIHKGVIKLDPDYQRRHRWTLTTSSRLIESLILNIPIPTIYLSQDVDVDTEVTEESRYSVIDGQQRLTAILNFVDNKFALTAVEALPELEGLLYNQLPPFLIRRLEERTIKCLRIDSTVDNQVKYDIFERLNSGSVKLEAQELRNAVSRGPFNDMIKELSKEEDFRTLIQVKYPESDKKVQKMEDTELVLRFFALRNSNYLNLKKGFKQFLDDEMKRLNDYDQHQLDELKSIFGHTMASILSIFGTEAFAKFRFDNGSFQRMSKFNAAVFDALAIAVADTITKSKKNHIIGASKAILFKDLFKNSVFFDATEGSVNDREKVVRRIDLAIDIMKS